MRTELLGSGLQKAKQLGSEAAVLAGQMAIWGVFTVPLELYLGVRGRFNVDVRADYADALVATAYTIGQGYSRFSDFGTLFWTREQRAEVKQIADAAVEGNRIRNDRIDRWMNEALPEGVFDEMARSMVQGFESGRKEVN